jgi:hypothetical protein
MNLDELRQAMASDATVENKNLKDEIEDLKKKLREEQEDHTYDKESLSNDCRCLANRCFALTKGAMCIFCELDSYHCSHAISFEDKLPVIKRLRKEIENA